MPRETSTTGLGSEHDDGEKTKTNVYCNYGSQEAGLAKHKLHTMNSKGIWYNESTRYKIHIIQYTVHNIKRRIKHILGSGPEELGDDDAPDW